jgi:hypothetical protein
MRLFALLNFQHVMAYLFVGWLFMVLFGVGLAFRHFATPDAEARKTAIANRFPEELADREGPFPLLMILIIAGTVLWGGLYIFLHGLWGIKI